jgi:hypothetical protein
MTRDPFAYDAIAEEAAAYAHPSPDHTWRRLLLVRPKTIPLGETSTLTATTGSKTTSDVVIADQVAPSPAAAQHRAPVQLRVPEELPPHLEEFMELFDTLGPIVSAPSLARELGCTTKTLRWGELHELVVLGVIEGVPGRGYRRVK